MDWPISQVWPTILNWYNNRETYFLPMIFFPRPQKSLGLFRKGKTRIIAKFHRTDLVI